MIYTNTKKLVDIHTTGQRKEFDSVRQYDKFLKEHNKVVLDKKDIKNILEPEKEQKINWKPLVEEAYKEREKYIKEAKERIAKEQYERRNGR